MAALGSSSRSRRSVSTCAGLGQCLFQRGLAAKRGRAGGGPDPHPVLRHPLQVDQVLGHEHRDALGQQVIEQAPVIAAKVGECVVIDADVAADPLVVDLLAAEFVEQAGAAHAAGGGVEPQGEEDPGVDGGAPECRSTALIR